MRVVELNGTTVTYLRAGDVIEPMLTFVVACDEWRRRLAGGWQWRRRRQCLWVKGCGDRVKLGRATVNKVSMSNESWRAHTSFLGGQAPANSGGSPALPSWMMMMHHLVDSSDVQPAAGTYFMKLSWERAVVGLCLHTCRQSLLALTLLSTEVVNCKERW